MSDDNVTIYYWPIAFRGNFLKLICEEGNLAYKTAMPDGKMMQARGQGKEGCICFAPPIIHHGDFELSQMTACAMYLANVCKLLPEGCVPSFRFFVFFCFTFFWCFIFLSVCLAQ